MTLLNLFNAITVICGIVATVAAIKIFVLTKASAVLWLVAATAYITVARLLISISQAHPAGGNMSWIDAHSSYFVFLYWPLKATAVVLLYLALKSIINPPYTGQERRKNAN